MDLEFNVNNQTLKRTDSNKPANWSDNYLRLVFNFESDDWTGLNKYCLLRTGGELYRVQLEEDKVTLPVGVLTNDKLVITLYGTDDEDYRVTTNMVSIILGKSGYNIEDIGDIPDIEDIYALIESKASTKYVNEQLSLKADLIYVDDCLNLKSDITYVDTELDKKANTVHTHNKSDITDFSHTHSKSEINDFTHTHNKSDITDFSHTHTESDITDLQDYALKDDVPTKTSDLTNDVPFLTEHQSLSDYYTKTEINQLIHELNNKMNVTSDKTIIQTGETSNITVQVKENGFPVENKTINIYRVI